MHGETSALVSQCTVVILSWSWPSTMDSSLTLIVLAEVLSCLARCQQPLVSSHQTFLLSLSSPVMRRDVYVIFALCRYIAGREMQDASPMLGRGGGRAAGSGLGFV
jgi:hypothetical protein